MSSSADDPQRDAMTSADPARPRALTVVPPDPPSAGRDHHPSRLGHRLDNYLAGVVRELNDRGVITGALQRTDPADRLIGSIDLDCTPLDDQPLEDGVDPARPVPVDAVWDEYEGWSVGLRHSSGRRSRRYLHPDLLPEAAVVGAFVVDVATGASFGVAHSIAAQKADTRTSICCRSRSFTICVSGSTTPNPARSIFSHPRPRPSRPGGSSSTPTAAAPRCAPSAASPPSSARPAPEPRRWAPANGRRSCSYSAVRMHPHELMSPVPVCRRCIGIFDLHR